MVTNPAIDREREMEHFSCRTVLGVRPEIGASRGSPGVVELAIPVILGGHDGLAPLGDETYRAIAHAHGTYLLEDLWEAFPGRARVLDLSCLESEDTSAAIDRLKEEAVAAVAGGRELLVLSDRIAYEGDRRYLDPHLALAAVDLALREHRPAAGRGEPAPGVWSRAALGGAAKRARHDARPRARRRRRLPVRDGRGLAAGRLPHRRPQPGGRPAQGDREGDLHHRDPRGPWLRAPVRLDRAQARAHGDLRHARLHGLAGRRHGVRRARLPTPRSACGCWPARRSPSPPRPSASTPRCTRRPSRRRRARPGSTSTRRRCARSSTSSRSRCATSSTSGPTASRSRPTAWTPASACTPTRS